MSKHQGSTGQPGWSHQHHHQHRGQEFNQSPHQGFSLGRDPHPGAFQTDMLDR